MARIPRTEVKEREQFMKELFLSSPELPMPQANTKFYERFGSKMRPQRVYAIRASVKTQLEAGLTPDQVVVEPAGKPALSPSA